MKISPSVLNHPNRQIVHRKISSNLRPKRRGQSNAKSRSEPRPEAPKSTPKGGGQSNAKSRSEPRTRAPTIGRQTYCVRCVAPPPAAAWLPPAGWDPAGTLGPSPPMLLERPSMTLSTGGIRGGRRWRASVGAWANRARVVRGAELRTKEQQRRRRGVKRGDLFFLSCNRSRRGERAPRERV
jgi:hypothetical protein